MKLQFAMDVATLDEALVLSRLVAEHVDIIEIGSPLIKNEGVTAIRAIKASYPDKTIFADMRTVDAGQLEADMAFNAGADLVSVMGWADDATVRGAVVAARRHGKGVVADMIGVRGCVLRARELARLGVEFCELHAGIDEQALCRYSIRAVIEAGRQSETPFSVAGGVDLDSILDVRASGAAAAVVGAAIHGAPDPRAAAGALRAAIDTASLFGGVTSVRQGRPHGIPCGPGPGPGPWRARRPRLADRASNA